jgi:hypothetical protein
LKVYLAAAWRRQSEMRYLAQKLDAIGVEITSRWLYEQESPNPRDRDRHRRETALIDIQDVRAADALVRFTDQSARIDGDYPTGQAPAGLATGARMFEMGLAWAEGKTIVVVGGHQPVFDYLPNVIHLKNEEELIQFLNPKEPS